jgi:methylated-DNA-[protein]-cysteine S-methyltransferase
LRFFQVNRMKQQRPPTNDFYDVLDTPLGPLYLIFTSGVLTGIEFSKPSDILLKRKEGMTAARNELIEYFKKTRQEFACRTAFTEGTEFEKKVWETLKKIPYGETRTYKWLAEEIGKPQAFRAVGNALGKNPIPIIFPCHRVIETDGSLGGYSGGVDIKRRLIEIEYYTKQTKD